MKINIDFFSNNFVNAIGAGIYEVTMNFNNKDTSLYIGESVFIFVRCAIHLYKIKNNPNYFGFDSESIENDKITLIFSLLKSENDTQKRKQTEKIYIKEKAPKLQSGISDKMKNTDDKINEIINLLKS